MITDRPPRAKTKLEQYARSEGLPLPELPPPVPLRAATTRLFESMGAGVPPPVRKAAQGLADTLAGFYGVAAPEVRVLGVRPHTVKDGICTYELHGDYTFATQRIRVWMRTAIREKVTTPRALLNTLLHEVCHHLDRTCLKLPDTYHTRGFFGRIDELYHLALDTAPHARRPLHWVKRGAVWQIDWRKTRTRTGG